MSIQEAMYNREYAEKIAKQKDEMMNAAKSSGWNGLHGSCGVLGEMISMKENETGYMPDKSEITEWIEKLDSKIMQIAKEVEAISIKTRLVQVESSPRATAQYQSKPALAPLSRAIALACERLEESIIALSDLENRIKL